VNIKLNNIHWVIKLFLTLLYFTFTGSVIFAADFNSSSFKVLDPELKPALYSTSTTFSLYGSLGDIAFGTSSASSFNLNPGFFPFPFVSTPVVSATAGGSQVSLSWTSASGFLGWSVGGYDVGVSSVSGGPYSFTTVSGTNSTITGLSNGSAYYFIVVVKDAFGNRIATSTQVSATPVAPPQTPGGTTGGGGFGGFPTGATESTVIFSGKAYPRSVVTLLKDAQVAATTVAGGDASFTISLSGVNPGSYIFSLYSEDKYGVRSSLLTFPIAVTVGAATNVGGIFIAPTIDVDKSEVKKGENITIFGQTAANSDVIISVNSEEEHFVKTKADNGGIYLQQFDTSVLELGQHTTRAKSSTTTEISSFGKTVGFLVGSKTVLKKDTKTCGKGDLNCDGKVNIVDFSILAYWYKRPNPPANRDLNGDLKVNLIDFSILAYYWTG
jgi:hypothetical protein